MTQTKQHQLEQEVIRTAIAYRWGAASIDELRVATDALANHLAEITNTPGYVGPNSPQTSIDAANSIMPMTGTLRRAIVNELYLDSRSWDREHEGMTCEQLETRLRRAHTSVSSAIYALRHAGWVFDSGRVRLTCSGRDAIVWRLTNAAHQALED